MGAVIIEESHIDRFVTIDDKKKASRPEPKAAVFDHFYLSVWFSRISGAISRGFHLPAKAI
jgi:hypothetical protein